MRAGGGVHGGGMRGAGGGVQIGGGAHMRSRHTGLFPARRPAGPCRRRRPGGGHGGGGLGRRHWGGGVPCPFPARPGLPAPAARAAASSIRFWFGPQFQIHNWQGYGFADPGEDSAGCVIMTTPI